ncbi:MAG: excinuclease ABC subunit UvrB [bacterium]
MDFKLTSKFKPAGDQVKAIEYLTKGIESGVKHQTLLGATGTGKTFTMANIIQNVGKTTLVLAHNKTLAAQLFGEFKEFFPENAVRYFVSYYDYYQPEAYVPQRDLFIEKEAEINKDIEKYRNASTQSLLSRKDTIIIASVSCIYGLGDPEDYMELTRTFKVGQKYMRDKILTQLNDLQYQRNSYDFEPGTFRVRGEIIDIYLASEDHAVKLVFFGDTLEQISIVNPITAKVVDTPDEVKIFPAKQFVTPFEKLKVAIPEIQKELKERIDYFNSKGRILEAKRIEQRVNFDLEMLREVGYVSGIENYSRIISGKQKGEPPSTLLDYFPKDWLLIVDESHVSIPQVGGMYHGDRARKENLVDYGFRLPSALDNRPLKFDEFNKRMDQAIYVSATPAEYELNLSKQSVQDKLKENIVNKQKGDLPKDYTGLVEQIIRPTGLLDPIVDIRPAFKENAESLYKKLKEHSLITEDMLVTKKFEKNEDIVFKGQIDDLISEILKTVKKKQRVLVTTLTKRMSEELTNYLKEKDVKVEYLHSDREAIERIEILNSLRLGVFDVVVGINLLREGLDLPEVSLVAILDADKEGFLRSQTSLIQTMGRAARHSEGRVIMYADNVTGSMERAVSETRRRRKIQEEYNKENNITPVSIIKEIKMSLERTEEEEVDEFKQDLEKKVEIYSSMDKKQKKEFIEELKIQMEMYADMTEFEKAARLRDILKDLTKGN